MDYEQIHEWLDQLDDARSELAATTSRSVDVGDFHYVGSILNDLYDASYMSHLLRIPLPVVRKFMDFGGTVSLKDARILTDRLRAYVKSMDQLARPSTENADDRLVASEQPKIVFQAIEWRSVPRSRDVKDAISEISRLLDSIIVNIKRSNNSPDNQYLSELERQQLISILETTLAILKAPVVEKGLILKARETLQSAGSKLLRKALIRLVKGGPK